jgi:hypothetical protein
MLLRTLIHTLLLLAMFASTGGPVAAQGRARELVERTIANQHRDDAALYGYERVERRVSFEEHAIASDKTYRLVPTGTGRLSLLIKRGGKPVSLASYRKELREWEKVLRHALAPNDPREQHSEEVRRRRDRKRAELINAIGKAYQFTWLGEEVVDGRTLVHITLEPNPSFHPTSRETEMLTHARASVWIDKEAAQLVRGRAEITNDISAGGGLISKIYAGGWFEIEQRRVAPGIWLPARTEFSIRGRMFLFSFQEHKLTETSRYRYIGTPRQALEVAREDLKSGTGFPGDR